MTARPPLPGWLAVAVLTAVLGAVQLTGTAGASAAARADDDPAALDLLRRAARADATTGYRGTQVVTARSARGTSTMVLGVEHVPGEGTRWTVRADGAHAPATGTDAGAQAGAGAAAALMASGYALRGGDRTQVAGRPARVVEAHRDGHLAARFFLDEETGVLLQREVFDTDGRLLRQSSFVDVVLWRAEAAGAGPPTAGFAAAVADDGLGTAELERLRRHGWLCPDVLAEDLHLVRATSEGTGGDRVLHLTFSDGVSTVSVFEQRGRLDADALGGWTARTVGGAPVHVQEATPWRAVWQSGGSVLTVVADAPPATAEAVVAALPHTGGSDGWWDRLARGARAVAALVSGS